MENTKMTWFEKQSAQFEQSRFATMTMMLTFQSCWGSIAAMLAMQNNDYVILSIVAAATMTGNSALIAQVPAKWCIAFFYGNVLINTFLMLVSLFIL